MPQAVTEISAKHLATMMRTPQAPYVIDVRHDWEYAAGALPEAKHVPLAQLADRAPSLPQDLTTPIVTYCHHGMRSAKAAHILMGMGYTQVVSLAGGIDAWAVDVDPGVERY
jgi:rhodanese-related sulfurtransferase